MSERSSGATSAGRDPRDSGLTDGRDTTQDTTRDSTQDTARDTTTYHEHDANPGHLGAERVDSHTTSGRTEQVREEPVRHERHEVDRHDHDHDRDHHDHDRQPPVALGADRHDGVRWGPVWAGLLTALTTFLLLELAFYAAGAIDLRGQGSGNDGIITGILALVAFFLGGLVAGATALWKGLFSGLLHGFLVWAVGVVAFIALTFFGASALLGSFGDLTSQLGVGPQEVSSATQVSGSEAEQASQDAKDAAAPAFWGLALPLVASMLGGLIGSKMWPRKKDQAVTGTDRR
jgi:hypothetical protein